MAQLKTAHRKMRATDPASGVSHFDLLDNAILEGGTVSLTEGYPGASFRSSISLQQVKAIFFLVVQTYFFPFGPVYSTVSCICIFETVEVEQSIWYACGRLQHIFPDGPIDVCSHRSRDSADKLA